MSIRNFSRIAASNAAVDNINFSENQAANTLNDSARELMADIAEWRDDNEGDLLTTGATNAYVLATRQTVPSLVTGVQLAFRASFANTGAATLNVDSLGAKAIRKFASLNSNVTQTGTYSRTGSTVTVTITSHGYVTGQSVILTFTTGAATNGTYVVTVTNANTFTVTDAASGTTSGNVSSVGPFLLAPSESALSANDIVLNGHYTVRYDTAANSGSGAWVLLNPSIQIGPLASKSALATSDYADNSILPSKLALGAWTTVASAATVDLGAQTSRNIIISGTTGITSFGSTATPDNVPFNVLFSGSLTLTHSANLICPGAANITTAAGDTLAIVQDVTGTWRIVNYQRATSPSNLFTAGTASGNLVRLSTGNASTGTYSRAGTTVTVTITAHGYTTGQFATLTFTTGTATSGTYQVTSTGANTFTVTDTVSGATSGNVSALGPVRLPAVDGELITSVTRLRQGASVSTTSGTAVDFTGIPSWAKRVTVMFNSLSTNGNSIVQIQIGSGSVVASGYNSTASYGTGASDQYAFAATGFIIEPAGYANATTNRFGSFILSLLGSNVWAASGTTSNGTVAVAGAGASPALAGALDRIRITTLTGTDTFDAGSVNILIEG